MQARVVETLLAARARLKATAMDDTDALHFAAQKGRTDISSILIKNGALILEVISQWPMLGKHVPSRISRDFGKML